MAAVMGVIIPGTVLSLLTGDRDRQDHGDVVATVTQSTQMTVSQETVPTEAVINSNVMLPVLMENGNIHMTELNEYLVGVVLAEMPASFEPEALKAQTVVARTYALKRYLSNPKHPQNAVCTKPECCQGYISQEAYMLEGGKQEDVEKIKNAVNDTGSCVLTYEGALIESTYFSCSGGNTEDALAVWGTDIPYLQATESPGEENAACYTDTVFLTKSELEEALDLQLAGEPEQWIGNITYTEGGGVDEIEIAGNSFIGTEIRRLLGLRSTAFTMEVMVDGISITTRGYGHRVGMSQYGADAMAAAGHGYAEILAHYYTGTVLESYEVFDVHGKA